MKTLLFGFLSIYIGICQGTAQEFRMETTIEAVEEDGTYFILISPEISSHLRHDFSDIRIYDEKNNEVPYILKVEKAPFIREKFKDYEIVERNVTSGCCTRLVIRNKNKSKIDNISLIIKNADVRKKARLSGSDNGTEWYTIKENYKLESLYSNSDTEEVKVLYFPLSNYEYFRLDIDDSLSLPISIVHAGYFDVSVDNASWITLPAPKFFCVDSIDKKTYVEIKFRSPHHIDQLKVNVSSPEYYLRQAKLCIKRSERGRVSYNELYSFVLKSNYSNTIRLSNLYEDELFLVVDNQDNPPLTIESIEALQIRRSLIANLQKDNNYWLRFSDLNAPAPTYDLKYYSEQLKLHPKKLKTGNINNVDIKEVGSAEFFASRKWIWLAIIVMIILLGFFSFKMVKDIKKSSG